jgi:hypothetical protein
VSHRTHDLNLLGELLGKHADELTTVEVEAFASMRFDLQAYGGILEGTAAGRPFHQLSDKQRAWVTSVHERVVPAYANLVSRGLVPKGTPTAESRALDAMLAGPKVLKPPVRRRSDE